MASYNKVLLMGNLTRDPEVKYTPKGPAMASFALAVNRAYTADNGEKWEEVTYVDIVLWSRLAELAGQYLVKGRGVFIEGRLQLESWTDKQTGAKRSRMRVVGEVMQFLGSKEKGEERREKGEGTAQMRRRGDAERGRGAAGGGGAPGGGGGDEFGEGPAAQGMEDDDIPF